MNRLMRMILLQLEKLMAWNDAEVTNVNIDKEYLKMYNMQKYKTMLLYSGLPGNSVFKDINNAMKSIYDGIFKVTILENKSKRHRHEYLIGF